LTYPLPDAWEFCNRILVDVSRSFALIIPRCPPPLDRCLCVGYLLCRLADTIEDDALLALTQRQRLYDALLDCIRAPADSDACRRFIHAWPALPDGGYGQLVCGTQNVLAAFRSLPADYQEPLLRCVHEMVAGMRSVEPVASCHGVTFYCRDLTELDRYCHHVAGTVGVMSTELFERYLASGRPEDSQVGSRAWREQGRRMGLGLQMTNIIKDAGGDADRGVSFIPPLYVEFVDGSPRVTDAGRAELIRHTLAHLDQAIEYTTALPASARGIRAFLLGSILPAVATLEIAATGARRDPKIDRQAMRSILEFIESAPGDAEIRAWYDPHRARCLGH
jgi:farnesyl-diphosphate farnesyltransferase